MTTTTIKLVSKKSALKDLLRDYNVSSCAKDICKKITLTKGKNYEVVIIKASDVGEYPTTQEIRDYAHKKGYETPPAEIGILIRQSLSDEDIKQMGLWYIVTMHKPIVYSDGDPCLLASGRDADGRDVFAYHVRSGVRWLRGSGFLFSVSQVSSKSSSNTLSSAIKKVSTTYEIEGNRVEIQDGKISLKTKSGRQDFIFQGSTPETCEKIARVLTEAAKLARLS